MAGHALASFAFVGAALLNTAAFPQPQPAALQIIAANAVKDGLEQLARQYQQQSGQRVQIVWSGTEATARRIRAGENYDVVLIGSDAIDRLVAAGKLAQQGRADFARTGVAVAVRAGYDRPAIDSPDALKGAVLAAPRVAYSAGPSGVYIETLMARLGIKEFVATKLTRPSSGAEVAALVQRGDVDLAFAQVSEFLGVTGLQNLGPLPDSLQHFTTYTTALPSEREPHPHAVLFIRFITDPAAVPAITAMGMEQPR
jgi:molybdate transport system substrate-binding protein